MLSLDVTNSRQPKIRLSTKKLEPLPGDMLKDPQLVFDRAEEMGKAWMRARKKARKTEKKARKGEDKKI